MKWVTAHAGALHVRSVADDAAADATTSSPVDVALAAGAVHELLFDARQTSSPAWLALLWARDAIARSTTGGGPLVWLDVDRTFYPPAARAAGVAFDRLCLVRPPLADVVRTTVECLRCRGVAGVVAPVPSMLSRVEARRLQLAVETGGGVGVLMRPLGRGCDVYAAATRWQVSPAPPRERASQRWRVEQVHGHGGHLGQPFFVEHHRARIDQLQHVPAVPTDADVPLHPPAGVVG